MTLPERTFSADEGQRSTGTAGPDQIEYDLDNLFASLNPDATLKNGAPGGIGPENLRTFYVDPDRTPTGNSGKPTDFLSWFANRLRELIGDGNWYDDPPIALVDIKQHVESVDGVHGADPGEVLLNSGNLVGGTGIMVTKHDGVVTLTATGGQTPGKHASSHSAGGSDPLTGYALVSHQHSGADVTSPVANATNATNASQATTAGYATSAGNADTVDGYHASAFAPASHTHTGGQITSAVASATNADTVDGKHASEFEPVVESGSNTNGDYIRFANGTQICWAYREGANPITWTYPAAFTEIDSVLSTVRAHEGWLLTGTFAVTTTSAKIYKHYWNGGWFGASEPVNVVAFGRWT